MQHLCGRASRHLHVVLQIVTLPFPAHPHSPVRALVLRLGPIEPPTWAGSDPEAAPARLEQPSAAARTLSRGRSDVVLYLLPPHLRLNTQFGDLLEHLSTALAEAGLTLVVHPWSRDLRPVTAVCSALSPVAVLA